MVWSARQYQQFEEERTRPARDLLAALPALDARLAIDIGCGPGNSTELLATRFPRATVCGFDASADMIEAARKRLPALRFEIADVAQWARADAAPAQDSFDVILANAVLQWVPRHAELFPALIVKLARGGALAVQMPDNLSDPAHRLMREIASAAPWSDKLADAAAARALVQGADWYYRLLRSSCAKVDVWRTTYHHPLAGGEHAVVDWFKGSGLRPFLEPLDDAERAAYLARYAAAVKNAYPPLPDGTVLLPFPRLFIVAQR